MTYIYVISTERVKGILNDAGIQLPEYAIDRAHRIGNTKEDGKSNITQPIIVRFTSFRARTVLYKARKSIKNKFKYDVSLDLTKSLLIKSSEIVENIENIHFVYNDINCNLRALTAEGKNVRFNSICDLQNVIANFE